MDSSKQIFVHFEHGLGDSANFARMIPLYLRRGFTVRVSTTPDKRWLFRSVGAEVEMGTSRGARHPWDYPDQDTIWEACQSWQGNKNGCNLARAPMPDIGSRDELWSEYVRPVDIAAAVPSLMRDGVRAAVAGLPRPIILLHTIGNTGQARKSIPREDHFPLYKELLDSGGTVIILDWDHRTPAFPNYRLRLLYEVLPGSALSELVALIDAADLMIGVDSGPLHLAGLTKTPRVGLFRDGHFPSTYLLPRGMPPRSDLSLTGGNRRTWTIKKRIPFAISETDWTAADVARQSLAMIDRDPVPASVRQILGKCRGGAPSSLGEYCDRHCTFRTILERAKRGTWVETGTIRQEEDCPGAGYSTYLFGMFLQQSGEGKLFSVDLDPRHCEFSRKQTAIFGDHVEVIESRGDAFLQTFEHPIDFLYLDSCDTTDPRHAQVCLDELTAALPKLAPHAIVAFDDTPWRHGNFMGKGTLAVPYLLDRGWRILHAGYQAILERLPAP